MDSFDGLPIFIRKSIVDEHRAVMLIIHGVSEHSGRYAHCMAFFAMKGISTIAPDLRGHGLTGPVRGDLGPMRNADKDIESIVRSVKTDFPGIPLFLFGHSMGGLIALRRILAERDSFRGCILSGVAAGLPENTNAFLLALSGLIAAVAPRLPLVSLDVEKTSRNEAARDALKNDELCYTGKIMARTGREIARAIRAVRPRLPEITLPLLVMHGGADALVPVAASEYVHAHVSSGDKELHVLPGLYHEILNEPEKMPVLKTMAAWMDRLIG